MTTNADLDLTQLPPVYAAFLYEVSGQPPAADVLFYTLQEIKERNQTWETNRYAPGYLAVGDDGGGRVIVIRKSDDTARPFIVGSGVMTEDAMSPLAPDWLSWAADGFRLTDE